MLKRTGLLQYPFIAMYLLLSLGIGGCQKEVRFKDTEGQIKYDSIMVTLYDSGQSLSREKQLLTYKTDWKKLVADTQKLQTRAFEELVNNFNANDAYYGKVISKKNEVIFSSNRKLIESNSDRPNIWVLIAIVLATGILGGLAGPRFSLLDADTENTVNESKDKIAGIRSQTINLLDTVNKTSGFVHNADLHQVIDNLEKVSTELESAADDLKKATERKWAYLLFGIIAASLSFLALSLVNSKILEFRTEIDYFIFTGYCLLSAVFAKKWIVQLYDAINKK